MDDSGELKTVRFRKLSFKLIPRSCIKLKHTAGGVCVFLTVILDFH